MKAFIIKSTVHPLHILNWLILSNTMSFTKIQWCLTNNTTAIAGVVVVVLIAPHMMFGRNWVIRVAVLQRMCCTHNDSFIKAPIVHMVLPLSLCGMNSMHPYRRSHFLFSKKKKDVLVTYENFIAFYK